MFGRAAAAARDFLSRKGPKTFLEQLIVFGALILTLVFIPVCAVGFAKDPSGALDTTDYDVNDLNFINQTSDTIRIYLDGDYQATVGAGETRVDDVFSWRHARLFEAVDSEGRVVYAARLSPDDLDQMHERIIIASVTTH